MVEMQKQYTDQIKPRLFKSLGLKTWAQVPGVTKVVLNTCIGEAVRDPKVLNVAAQELSAIAGQKAVVTKAKKAIANFKLRAGMPLGAMVTLRRERMWAFLERLVHLSLPRVRDFRGLPPSGFDGCGNYNLGVKEQIIFAEIDYDKVQKIRGFNISIHTSATSDDQGFALLEALGFPFKKRPPKAAAKGA